MYKNTELSKILYWNDPKILDTFETVQTVDNDLPKIRLHDIRHLIGTYSINILELPIEKISHTLGHTNVATTEKYVTIKPETSKQVIDKIFASVESV